MFSFMKFMVSVVYDSYKPKSTDDHQCDDLGGVIVWIPHRYAKTGLSVRLQGTQMPATCL